MKKALYFIGFSILFIATSSCQSQGKKAKPDVAPEIATLEVPDKQDLSGYEKAYFASGCFWCVEAIFESVRGVAEVVSGYAGGTEVDPTYEQVSYGRTGHAEAVEVYYDPEIVSYFELVQVFFGSHDPTTPNRQGPDRGPQYRSIAFYKSDVEQKTIRAYMDALEESGVYEGSIVTEITPFTKFYPAEDYHQDYEKNNPNNPYVQNISIPRLNRFKANFADFLKEDLH